MLDLKFIRENIDLVRQAIEQRQNSAPLDEILHLDSERRRVRTLPIDDNTSQMLRDYIRRGGPVQREGKMLIFGINRHRAWQVVRECAEKAEFPDSRKFIEHSVI